MPHDFNLRGIPDDLYEALRQEAEANRLSVTALILLILEGKRKPPKVQPPSDPA